MMFKSIRGSFKSFKNLVREIEKLPKRQSTLLIGIDGCGGSGKSTFACELSKLNSNITVVHMDDFYLPSSQRIKGTPMEKPIGADFDWQRLRDQVIKPLTNNKEGKYQKYDWGTDSLTEWYTVPIAEIVIIEGIYSTRKELADFYDFKIFVDCLREIRLQRGLERDGEDSRDMWENNWMVAEDKYLIEHKPFERADLVIDGTGNL
jgi:uridine kinase